MNLADITTLTRDNTGVDAVQFPDAKILTITNLSYRDLINIITSKISEDFFYEEWTGNTIIGQSEYTFPIRSSTEAGLKKLISVNIKYKSTDQYFTPATPTTISDLIYDRGYYEINQPTSDPLYVVYDKSIAIFPKPTEVNNFKLYGVSDPKELISGDSESDIKIPVDFHHLIVLSNEYKIYKMQKDTQRKNDALVEYKNELREMITQLTDRIIKPLESEMPNLKHLQ